MVEELNPEVAMKAGALRLRVYMGERARSGGHPLHEAIVHKAREIGLAGATVFRAAIGYGHSSRLRTSKILSLSEDLPLVVEIVDSEAKIQAFLPELDGMSINGLITLDPVQVHHYGSAARA